MTPTTTPSLTHSNTSSSSDSISGSGRTFYGPFLSIEKDTDKPQTPTTPSSSNYQINMPQFPQKLNNNTNTNPKEFQTLHPPPPSIAFSSSSRSSSPTPPTMTVTLPSFSNFLNSVHLDRSGGQVGQASNIKKSSTINTSSSFPEAPKTSALTISTTTATTTAPTTSSTPMFYKSHQLKPNLSISITPPPARDVRSSRVLPVIATPTPVENGSPNEGGVETGNKDEEMDELVVSAARSLEALRSAGSGGSARGSEEKRSYAGNGGWSGLDLLAGAADRVEGRAMDDKFGGDLDLKPLTPTSAEADPQGSRPGHARKTSATAANAIAAQLMGTAPGSKEPPTYPHKAMFRKSSFGIGAKVGVQIPNVPSVGGGRSRMGLALPPGGKLERRGSIRWEGYESQSERIQREMEKLRESLRLKGANGSPLGLNKQSITISRNLRGTPDVRSHPPTSRYQQPASSYPNPAFSTRISGDRGYTTSERRGSLDVITPHHLLPASMSPHRRFNSMEFMSRPVSIAQGLRKDYPTHPNQLILKSMPTIKSERMSSPVEMETKQQVAPLPSASSIGSSIPSTSLDLSAIGSGSPRPGHSSPMDISSNSPRPNIVVTMSSPTSGGSDDTRCKSSHMAGSSSPAEIKATAMPSLRRSKRERMPSRVERAWAVSKAEKKDAKKQATMVREGKKVAKEYAERAMEWEEETIALPQLPSLPQIFGSSQVSSSPAQSRPERPTVVIPSVKSKSFSQWRSLGPTYQGKVDECKSGAGKLTSPQTQQKLVPLCPPRSGREPGREYAAFTQQGRKMNASGPVRKRDAVKVEN